MKAKQYACASKKKTDLPTAAPEPASPGLYVI